MKLTKNTLTVLKNFSGISNMLRIRPGSTLLTATESRSLVAQANVEEVFENDLGIYDLSQFLGAVTLLGEPDIEFGTQTITMKDGNRTINLPSGSIKVVEGPKNFPMIRPPIVTFPFTADLLSRILKSASILSAPDFLVAGDGEVVSVQVLDNKKSSGGSFIQPVGQSDKTFQAIVRVETLQLIPSDYEAFICDKRMIVFKSQSLDLTYCAAVYQDSQFDW